MDKVTLEEAKEIIEEVNRLNAAQEARKYTDCDSDYKELYATLCTYDDCVENADEEDATHIYIACTSWPSGEDAESIIDGLIPFCVQSIEYGDGGRDDKSLMIEIEK